VADELVFFAAVVLLAELFRPELFFALLFFSAMSSLLTQ
jgi:hypothetical protein